MERPKRRSPERFDGYIKGLLRFSADTPDELIRDDWEERINSVCKPCWELKYCPYGRLVEDFPLPRALRDDAIEHNEYLKECLQTGRLADGRRLGKALRRSFERQVSSFRSEDYPEKLSDFELDARCNIFGHLCPVFFVNEPFTETDDMRKIGRHIPFITKLRVARRDNYTCQACGKHLREHELEFDHIIPVSKGGSSEEHNVRLTCFDCNRTKSNRVDL